MELSTRRRAVEQVAATDAHRLHADAGALLLDVREPAEWRAGHAPGAMHVPLRSLDARELPAGLAVVVVVCRSGNRSNVAAAQLAAAGVDARNLAGGLHAWAAAGLPVVTDDGGPGTVA